MERQDAGGDAADVVGQWSTLHSAVAKSCEVLSMPELLSTITQKQGMAMKKKVEGAFLRAGEALLMWPQETPLTAEAMESFIGAWQAVQDTAKGSKGAEEVAKQLQEEVCLLLSSNLSSEFVDEDKMLGKMPRLLSTLRSLGEAIER